MTLRFRALLSLVFVALPASFVACSGGSGGGGAPDPDAGSDATVSEAGPAAPDGGATAQGDGGSNAEVDAAIDAGSDGADDAGEGDAGAEGGPERLDAGVDAEVDAGPPCAGCVVLATATFPVALVVDATSVYWLDNGGTVSRVPIGGLPDGGAPMVLASNQELSPPAASENGGLAVDSTYAYWATLNDIYKAPIDGSSAPVMVGGGAGIVDIALMDGTLYYTAQNDFVEPFSAVYSFPASTVGDFGAQPSLFGYAGQVGRLAVNANGLFFMSWPSTVFAIPLTGVPDGGAPTTIATSQNESAGVALGPTQVFWTGMQDGVGAGLFSAPQTGVPDGGAPTAFSSTPAGPDVACDGTNVYWTQSEQILEAPVTGVPDGGAPKVLASSQAGVYVLTADPGPHGNVYWATWVSAIGAYWVLQIPK